MSSATKQTRYKALWADAETVANETSKTLGRVTRERDEAVALLRECRPVLEARGDYAPTVAQIEGFLARIDGAK